MKVVHLLAGGDIGGIETLCKDYAKNSQHKNVMVILWGDGAIGKEMQDVGINIIFLHAPKKNSGFIIKKVFELCRNEKADVLIAHHAAPIAHLCLLFSKMCHKHIRTIAYAHGNAVDIVGEKRKKGLWLRKHILKISFKYADRVVAISESVKCSLLSYFRTPANKITVIYNGVDIDRFSCPHHSARGDVLHMIYVGRLIKEKGVQIIPEALTYIKSKGKYHLQIVGDGDYRQELERFVQKHGLNNMVEFLGSRRDIPELLSTADVFVHTPVWEEGFGITIIEAMAEGVIPVCACSGAIPEIITNGEDGFLVEMHNARQLADILETVATMSEEQIEIMRGKARGKATCFSLEKYTAKLDALIRSNIIYKSKKCNIK